MAAICPPDSAERQIRYCDTTIKKNKEVSIAAHGYRLQQLNNMQIFLPTLKMQKGSPAGLVAMDKKVNELTMCSRLVASLHCKQGFLVLPDQLQRSGRGY